MALFQGNGHPLSLDAWGRNAVAPMLDALRTTAALAVDATAGNGHDTLFLARALGPQGRVWAFDVQEMALETVATRLEDARAQGEALAQVTLVHQSHAVLSSHVPPGLGAVFFNLGWLPGSDKSVTTSATASLEALEQALELLAPGGFVWVHGYTGHPGGTEECAALVHRLSQLAYTDWRVLHTETCNKSLRPEHLLVAQKR